MAPQPEAVEAGVELMRAGGNAVDAAVGCALVQTVVDPINCGIAGFGSCGIYTVADATLRYMDFHAPAPLAATPDMWADAVEGEARDGFGFIVRGNANELGYLAICTPATLIGLFEVHRRFGQLPWPTVVDPAIDWSERGWVVRPGVEALWSVPGWMGHAGLPEHLSYSTTGRALYCRDDGAPKRTGDTVRNADYAETLRTLATDGVDAFYRGDIAAAIVEDMATHGGLLDRRDLESYQPKWNQPLWGTYRDVRVGTNVPPGGGAMLLEMLNTLEAFDLRGLGHNTAAYIETVSEAMRRATVDKDRHLADPDFVDVPLAWLTSKEHAAEIADAIRSGVRVDVQRLADVAEHVTTTHLSVVDGDGNCVSLTHSLGIPSGVITEGLGFMYNGCMGVFDPRPGRPHSIAPGKSRFSSIMPSILFQDGRPLLVVGAPGGTEIAMGVLQTVLNVIDFDMSMVEAVSAARFAATSNVVDLVNRIPRSTAAELERDGYATVRSPSSYGIAMVHGIRIDDAGRLDGGADPAADGMALEVAL